MMTLQGGCVQPNHHFIFSRSTVLIMDVTNGHVYNVHHRYKSGNLRQMEGPSDRNTLNIINSNMEGPSDRNTLNTINGNIMHSPQWWQFF